MGWLSSDAEEMKHHRWCGRTEIDRVSFDRIPPSSGSFRVPSTGGRLRG